MMETKRIGSVAPTGTTGVEPGAKQLRRRLDPHATTGFDKTGGRADLSALDPEKAKEQEDATFKQAREKQRTLDYRCADGSSISIPMLSLADQAAADRAMQRVSPEKRAEVRRRAQRLGDLGFDEAANNPAGVAKGEYSSAITQQTQDAFIDYALNSASDQNAQNAREYIAIGLQGVEDSLMSFFDQVKQKTQLATEVRTDQAELKEIISEWPDDGSTKEFTYRDLVFGEDNSVTVVTKTETLTKEQAQGVVDRLATQLDSMSSIANIDQIKLQKLVQDYQQVTTILSNIIKNQDETLRSTISNVRA